MYTHARYHTHTLPVWLPASVNPVRVPGTFRRQKMEGGSAAIRVMDGCQLSLGCFEDGQTATHQRQRHARQEFLIENQTELNGVETILVFSEFCLRNLLLK